MARLVGAAAATTLLALTAASYGLKFRATPLPLPVFPALTIVFITSGSVIVSYIAARAYMKSGLASTLFVGSGSLVFGSTSLIAALAAGEQGSNAATAIFILGALASSGLHLACAASRFLREADREGSRVAVTSAAVLSLALVAAVAAAPFLGALPRFLTPGVGTTEVAKAALGVSIVALALASLLIGAPSRSAVLYWYTWALAATAVGLLGLLLSDWEFEAIVFWVGRISLCVGGLFLVLTVLAAERGEAPPREARG